ncbi:MAG: type II toxin-antitoxin system PemK/MazF family toxin [Parcubacteria group bacterium]|nr:type II toxin-antitoxin system PemK/MazF family toxin [Parcubacteria group bacterium]
MHIKQEKNISIRRGDVVIVNFDPTIGAEIKKIRPALVIQNDIGNTYSNTIIVTAITSREKGEKRYPTEVFLEKGDAGLEDDSVVLLSHIRTIDIQRIIKKIGKVNSDTMQSVDTALEISVGLVEV